VRSFPKRLFEIAVSVRKFDRLPVQNRVSVGIDKGHISNRQHTILPTTFGSSGTAGRALFFRNRHLERE
jgi:hypothetical protein